MRRYDVLLSRRLLCSRTTNREIERNIVARIRTRFSIEKIELIISTGVMSASSMDSLLNDMENTMSG